MKLSLPAVVPNEGARRLANHVMTAQPSLERFARKLGFSETTVERLVRGDLRPGVELIRAIHLATNGAVQTQHWNRRPEGRWFDPVLPIAA